MKPILIGSAALKQHFPNVRQECHDLDYLVDGYVPHDRKSTPQREYFNWHDSPGLEDFAEQAAATGIDCDDYILPSASLLYTLKMSHIFWKINFGKHARDIVFMQHEGVELNRPLFDKLYEGWVDVHGKKRAYLKKDNSQFFTKAVDRKYVHDDIHAAVAYYDRPLYERCKPDLTSAYVSYKMFEGLDINDKLRMCWEETYVIALERFLIPADYCMSTLAAYRKAVELVLTSLWKGKFATWYAENLLTLNKPEINFVELFKLKEADLVNEV